MHHRNEEQFLDCLNDDFPVFIQTCGHYLAVVCQKLKGIEADG